MADFDTRHRSAIREITLSMYHGTYNGRPQLFRPESGPALEEWNDLVRRGRFRDAIERLPATNNFPDFTGRLCPAPCEPA